MGAWQVPGQLATGSQTPQLHTARPPKRDMILNGLVGWRREGNAKVAAGHNRDAAEAVGAECEWPKGGTHKGLLPKDAWADQRECVADGMRIRKGKICAVNANRRAIPGWY